MVSLQLSLFTAYLLCPRLREAHMSESVQGREILSVDFGGGGILPRGQQCSHHCVLSHSVQLELVHVCVVCVS